MNKLTLSFFFYFYYTSFEFTFEVNVTNILNTFVFNRLAKVKKTAEVMIFFVEISNP